MIRDEENFLTYTLKNEEVGHCKYKLKKDSVWVEYIHVEHEYRRQGIGSKLLQLCEDYIKSKGRSSARLVFLSPINWPWYIPHTEHHEHPGTPAIRINSEMYIFLYHHNYFVNSIHEGFHLPLSSIFLTTL